MNISGFDLLVTNHDAGDKAESEAESELVALPASYAQRRLWFLDQWSPGSSAYNVPDAYLLSGRLQVDVLEHALNVIVQRHEVLRTTFALQNGAPVQVIAPPRRLRVCLVDLSPEGETREALRLASEEAGRPFDLAKGPLIRATVYRLTETEHMLLITSHHIVTDGWSVGVFLHELSELYAAFQAGRPSPLPELPIQYADFALWQQEWLQGDVLEEQLAYWRRNLSGPLPTLQLPMAAPRSASLSERGGMYTVDLPRELASGLAGLAQREDATLFMLMLVGLAALLDRYTGQHDIIIGAPIANRNRVEIENLIGFFTNTLPLRLDLSGDPTTRDALRRTREVCLGAYGHQDVPFENLVDAIQPERDPSVTPLFQVALTVVSGVQEPFTLGNVTVCPVDVDLKVAKFDLTLDITQTVSTFSASFNYRSDLFDAETIRRMAGHFQTLLEGMVASPDRALSRLPLVTPAERHQLVNEWGAASASHAADSLIHERFEAQVERTPDATALVFEDQQISYTSLNRQADELAQRLRLHGVGPETFVAVCLERSPELVVALLATLKAGGAYVPLDPAYPHDRLAFMLEDCQAPVIITDSQFSDRLPHTGAVILELDTYSSSSSSSALPPRPTSPHLAAYVIYTSGSTGKPKGVVVTHANVTRLFDATHSWFRFDERDVWTLFHSYAFDFSVWEMWGALLHGGTLVIVPYLTSRSPAAFRQLVRQAAVTVLNQTPSAFRQFMLADEQARDENRAFSRLRLVIFGGEALDLQCLRPWFARHSDRGPELVNMYGITETTVHVTYRPICMADVEADLGSVIGKPIPDLELYVLDQHRQPVPVGVPGELYVGGAGLARGYLSRPELTEQRFVRHPFRDEPGARLYRSGDLARYLPNGDLEYLGRIDHQVKLRGFRIELGEIEAALSQHEAVREAVVLLREDVPGEKRLVAYVVLRREDAAIDTELRTHLRAMLPDYMVPAVFVVCDTLPLTVNGKIDRRALPASATVSASSEAVFVAPSTPMQTELAAIWADVLNLERVAIHDNFFALGGDSIRSVRVLALARERGLSVTLQQLFRHQTIESLSRELVSDTHAGAEEATQATDLAMFEASAIAYEPSSLQPVPFQTTGFLPPLFLVHPAGGGVTSYAELAQALGPDQPVYGLQSRGLADEGMADASVESMAQTYAEAIFSVQPRGPYHLGGWSLGGIIAFELAQLLQRRGETVASLVLLDTWAPTEQNIPADDDLLRLFAANLTGLAGIDLAEVALSTYKTEDQRLAALVTAAGEQSTLLTYLALEDVRQLYRTFTNNMMATACYRPATYAHPVLLLRAAESDEARKVRLGWSEEIVPNLHTFTVPGDHFTMLRAPHLPTLAQKFRQWLEAARQPTAITCQ